MAITKSGILAFVNAAFQETCSGTDLDIQIKLCVDDLAEMHVLDGEDATQTLSDLSTYLEYPSDCLDTAQSILSITLTDSSGVRHRPLVRLPGGWDKYQRLMRSVTTGSTPLYWVPRSRRIYIYPMSGGSYTTSIWYYRRHQAIGSGFEFDDTWEKAIFFGTAYYTALLKQWESLINIWLPQYQSEKEERRLGIPRDLQMLRS